MLICCEMFYTLEQFTNENNNASVEHKTGRKKPKHILKKYFTQWDIKRIRDRNHGLFKNLFFWWTVTHMSLLEKDLIGRIATSTRCKMSFSCLHSAPFIRSHHLYVGPNECMYINLKQMCL